MDCLLRASVFGILALIAFGESLEERCVSSRDKKFCYLEAPEATWIPPLSRPSSLIGAKKMTWLGEVVLYAASPRCTAGLESACYKFDCVNATTTTASTQPADAIPSLGFGNVTVYLAPPRADATHHNMWGFTYNLWGPLMKRVDAVEGCRGDFACLAAGASRRAVYLAEPRTGPRREKKSVTTDIPLPDNGLPAKWRRALSYAFQGGVFTSLEQAPSTGQSSFSSSGRKQRHSYRTQRLVASCPGAQGETSLDRSSLKILRAAGFHAYLSSARAPRRAAGRVGTAPNASTTAPASGAGPSSWGLGAVVSGPGVQQPAAAAASELVVMHVTRRDVRYPCRTLADDTALEDAFARRTAHLKQGLKWHRCCAWDSPTVAADTVALAASADVFFGMHGAGLAHCTWMREGATFVEVGNCHNVNRWYFNFCEEFGSRVKIELNSANITDPGAYQEHFTTPVVKAQNAEIPPHLADLAAECITAVTAASKALTAAPAAAVKAAALFGKGGAFPPPSSSHARPSSPHLPAARRLVGQLLMARDACMATPGVTFASVYVGRAEDGRQGSTNAGPYHVNLIQKEKGSIGARRAVYLGKKTNEMRGF